MHYGSPFCVVALAAALLATPSGAQVVDFGKYPDFKGQWVRMGNPNNWLQLAGPPALTPEYRRCSRMIQADLAVRRPRQLAVDLLRSRGHAGDNEPL